MSKATNKDEQLDNAIDIYDDSVEGLITDPALNKAQYLEEAREAREELKSAINELIRQARVEELEKLKGWRIQANTLRMLGGQEVDGLSFGIIESRIKSLQRKKR